MNHTERYLSLLKKSLINDLYIENEARIYMLIQCLLSQGRVEKLVEPFIHVEGDESYKTISAYKETGRTLGIYVKTDQGVDQEWVGFRNFFAVSHSMIGRQRMQNLHECLDIILREGVDGDLIETGVWRGGATIFMRGFLAAHDVVDRKVWVADSFDGLPVPSMPADLDFDFSKSVLPYLAISLREVKELFQRYDLLDDQVRFLQGWFKDTLPNAPIEKLALLRLDGDLYESTMDGLNNLYHKVSPGGFVIVDDYYAFSSCKVAVDEFREKHGIVAKMIDIDPHAVYWRV